MHLFIGLTFKPSSYPYQKIDSFRQRFDSKYSHCPPVQMSLLAPFSMESSTVSNLEDFIELCCEDLESSFLGHDQPLDVNFKGFDFKTGKKNILFLKPTLPVDLFYAQEVLRDAVKRSAGSFHKQRNLAYGQLDDLQTFLPIARGEDLKDLALAVDTAQIEFGHSAFQMEAQNIVLFEKVAERWVSRKILYSFSTTSAYGEKEDLYFSRMKTTVNL